MKSVIGLACFALSVGIASSAHAQADYPNKPIKVLVPYAAGGTTDLTARIVGEQLRVKFKQAVVVENKPGASGILAIQEMARSKPDGYTVMVGNVSTNGLTPLLLTKRMTINYDKDVQLVSRLADLPVFLAVTTKDFPVKTFAEFIAYAKERPGKVRYGSAGMGSYQQVDMEHLAKRAGIELTHIPIKAGGAGITRDVATGDVHVTWFNPANAAPMIKAGNLRVLAVAYDKRLPDYPDVPTLAELGYAGVGSNQWQAMFAPSGVPADVLDMLSGAVSEVLATQQVADAYAKYGIMFPPRGSRADAQAWYAGEVKHKKDIIGQLNIQMDE